MPARWAAYVRRQNALADFTARLIEVAEAAGVLWLVENPADFGDAGGMAWWPQFASTRAPLAIPPCARGAGERWRRTGHVRTVRAGGASAEVHNAGVRRDGEATDGCVRGRALRARGGRAPG
eukprot:3575985-Pleurochrysis_carterae.AAC.1